MSNVLLTSFVASERTLVHLGQHCWFDDNLCRDSASAISCEQNSHEVPGMKVESTTMRHVQSSLIRSNVVLSEQFLLPGPDVDRNHITSVLRTGTFPLPPTS